MFKNVDNLFVFRFQRHIYGCLLQRYLLLKYRTESEAKAKYCHLMNAIQLLDLFYDKLRKNNTEENFTHRENIRKMFTEFGI